MADKDKSTNDSIKYSIWDTRTDRKHSFIVKKEPPEAKENK